MLQRSCVVGAGLGAFSLTEGEDRDAGEWRCGAQTRRCEDQAPCWEPHGDALRLAGDAEADRAEVADHVDGDVFDRRLAGRIEGGVP
jgi:hypothetical protein